MAGAAAIAEEAMDREGIVTDSPSDIHRTRKPAPVAGFFYISAFLISVSRVNTEPEFLA